MYTLFVMVGLPGCGKSTYIKKTLVPTIQSRIHGHGPLMISRDQMVEDLAKSVGLTYSEVFVDSAKIIDKAFRNSIDKTMGMMFSLNRPLVWDQTNLGENTRRKLLKRFASIKMNYKVAIQFPPLAYTEAEPVLKSRPGKNISQEVYEKMAARYEPPALSEGFDEIWIVRPYQKDNILQECELTVGGCIGLRLDGAKTFKDTLFHRMFPELPEKVKITRHLIGSKDSLYTWGPSYDLHLLKQAHQERI